MIIYAKMKGITMNNVTLIGMPGSGKSTLAHLLSGRQGYDLTRGTVEFLGRDLVLSFDIYIVDVFCAQIINIFDRQKFAFF